MGKKTQGQISDKLVEQAILDEVNELERLEEEMTQSILSQFCRGDNEKEVMVTSLNGDCAFPIAGKCGISRCS